MADSSRLFVTGSTGGLGRLVIRELLKRVPAGSIVAGVRSTRHDVARQFAAQGVEVRVADYTRPDTLSAAFEGIDRLLLISSSAMGGRTAQHGNAIEAAKAAGVGLLAYTSLLHADASPLGLGEEHRRTEALLKASGLPIVLLRHGWYTENHLASVPPALQYGAVLGSAGEGRFSTATRADFAEAAAVVLTTDGHAGRVYELAGDESYTLADLAAAIAAASGRPVVYKDMPKADFKGALVGMGLPEDVAELVADSDAAASTGGLEDNGRQLSALIGRPTTPWRQTVEQAVAAT
ncbi:SDR family oxidoreductase [Fulvimonas soli]|uniref:NAD(P)H dehydrogenase (Quinone) n=1 Tax=Fulvimonas soli TaxID=155197 RepID=A0A316IAS0_9GAMM|nr:SDR family oxidoreductase [Fulvimonas soli]PWK89819.1 NAD(P)H dehydrogenase (quinone) [Fulvimonas soli]TNY27543.1 NAD(P)-dependent oxidoreductase [Fulvimonas soli]